MPTIRELAEKMDNSLILNTRADGSDYWWVKDDKSEPWMMQVIVSVRSVTCADDYNLQFVRESLSAIAEYDNLDDAYDSLEADVYTSDLTRWLASSVNRTTICDEAVEEYGGEPGKITDILMLGQLSEKRSVFDAVVSELERLVSESEDDDNETETKA